MSDLEELLEGVMYQFCCRIDDGELAGWYDSNALSVTCDVGDKLVELGLWERHPDGYGRRWFYRPIAEEARVRMRPEIVCLCGSTRFAEVFWEVGWQLMLEGYIVLSIGVCKHAEDHGAEALGPAVVERLDELHLCKIDLADWIKVINVGGYIGDSTEQELAYAMYLNKPVKYLEG